MSPVPVATFPTPRVTVLCTLKDKVPGVDLAVHNSHASPHLYQGPHPVLCLPPYKKWVPPPPKVPGEHWKRTPSAEDGALHAFHLVNTYGGVLAHPASHKIWKSLKLPVPGIGWSYWRQGWICKILQKSTVTPLTEIWVYCAGTADPIRPKWGVYVSSGDDGAPHLAGVNVTQYLVRLAETCTQPAHPYTPSHVDAVRICELVRSVLRFGPRFTPRNSDEAELHTLVARYGLHLPGNQIPKGPLSPDSRKP